MLYILYGDAKKCFEKSEQMIETMLSKKPDATILKINSDNVLSADLNNLINSQALFAQKNIITLARCLEEDNFTERVILNLKKIADSQNIFIFVEPDINDKTLKKIEKYAEKVQELKSINSDTKIANGSRIIKNSGKNINNFVIADSLGERNIKKLWKLFTEAVREETSTEEIFGILWWQVKSMILASKTKTAHDAGMKDFPYNKSKRFAKNFTQAELSKLADSMMQIYHDSRRGGSELEIRLEKLILNLSK